MEVLPFGVCPTPPKDMCCRTDTLAVAHAKASAKLFMSDEAPAVFLPFGVGLPPPKDESVAPSVWDVHPGDIDRIIWSGARIFNFIRKKSGR